MNEFGHQGAVLPGFGCIDTWGRGPYVIEADGKSFRFEDSDRFGPSLINKDGEIKKRPFPGGGSPFWRAHRCWVRQGRQTAEDGVTCIWTVPKPTIVRVIGRTAIVVQQGEEDGGMIDVTTVKPLEQP
jgi:hypothetical protein